MSTKPKTAAVVVTFNRKKLLLECLDALLMQSLPLDAIFVIDNASTDGTSGLLLERGFITGPGRPASLGGTVINYVRLSENTGASGGFSEGIKRAFDAGFDWIWVMDDDSEPKDDALEKFSRHFGIPGVSAFANAVCLATGAYSEIDRGFFNLSKKFPAIFTPVKRDEYKKGILKIDMASFVGVLIKREAVEKIGLPVREFFIHCDDVDYSIRLGQAGNIMLVTDSIIYHKPQRSAALVSRSFLFFKRDRFSYDRLWMNYFVRRNLVWVIKKYTENKFNFYAGLFLTFIKNLSAIFLFDDRKIKRTMFLWNAYRDGLNSNFDNAKPKRILYQ